MDDKEIMREGLRRYVEAITEPSKGNMYKCPLPGCNSGEGKKHTGAFSIDPKKPTRWKCFSCGRSGDIFDLIGEVEGLATYPERERRAREFLGMYDSSDRPGQSGAKGGSKNRYKVTTNPIQKTGIFAPAEEAGTKPAEDFRMYYRACHARLKECDYLERRGISQKTAERFTLGYDFKFTNGGKMRTPWKALIIPTGASTYVARNMDPEADSDNRYRAVGERGPFFTKPLHQADRPLYVVEGELDAISIAEAGGEALALGGIANWAKVPDAVKGTAQPVVLALDNDKPGWKTTDQLEPALTDSNIPHYVYNPYGDHKDANEALTANREELELALRKGEEAEERARDALRAKIMESSPATHLQEFINGITESVNTPAIPTGFRGLDSVLDGGLYEGLYFVGAIPSLGKTTLVLQIADQVARAGHDVLIFSLEMARAELMAKSISRHTLTETLATDKDMHKPKTARGITSGDRYKGYSAGERELIKKAITSYGEYAQHLFIIEGVGDLGTDQVREAVQRHTEATGRAPLVIVDYVQILAPHDVRASDKQATDRNTRELKRISRDFKTPVIAISSFNRSNYSVPVTMEAFKESGGLEYGSDVLIGLQLAGVGGKDFDVNEAKSEDPRKIELVILKNRNGRTGDTVGFQYYPMFNYFKER